MADDFVVEEKTSSRAFIFAVLGMAALFVISVIAIVIIALTRRGAGASNEIAIMNQTIEAQNLLVTQTVVAMETEAAYTPPPSPRSPTAAPTSTPTQTKSPAPAKVTPSPVAQTAIPLTPEAEEGDATEEAPTAPAPTPTIGPSGGQLPPGGMGMWGAILAAVVLVSIIMLARRLRPTI
ncbi:MAG: hypothetical protein GQ526_09035 [Ardenticatenales bacterium]|nr:hypothetical protein [Ardenticatenales bacterium]